MESIKFFDDPKQLDMYCMKWSYPWQQGTKNLRKYTGITEPEKKIR